EAIKEAEAMVELARSSGDRRGEAVALAQLATAHWATMSGDHLSTVERLTDEALAIAREVGDDEALIKNLELQGMMMQTKGDVAGADAKAREAVRIAEARGTPGVAAFSYLWIGAHADWRGDFPGAATALRHAEGVAREAGDGFNELMALAFQCKTHI